MKPKFIILCLIAALLLTPLTVLAQSAPLEDPEDPSEIESFIDGIMAVSMKENHCPGVVIVIVKDNYILFEKGYGYSDLAMETPVDPERTLFRPGSVSKLFTWTAVMQLVEQGKLDLNTDINEYLDFEIPNTYDTPITMAHLMSHTPGFEEHGQGLFSIDLEDMISNEDYLKRQAPARVYPPGTIGAYSNYGTALAGYIVERISGMRFEDYIDANILAPLDMTQATFEQPLPDNLANDLSGGFNFVNGKWIEGPFEIINGSPAGGLSASGRDMAKFMIAHLNNGEYNGTRILQEDTVQLMHSPLYTPDPRMGGMAHGFFYTHVNGQTVLSHGGDTMMFHSELMLLAEENIGIFISTNGTKGNNLISTFRSVIFDHYYPVEKLDAAAVQSDFSDRAALYTGSYTSSRSNQTNIEQILNLMMPSTVTVIEDGTVLINQMGHKMTLVEIEPGLLVNPEQTDEVYVMKEVDGQVQLHPSMPMVLVKNRWFESNGFHIALIISEIVLLVISILVWITGVFIRHKHQIDKPAASLRLSRWAAVLFFAVMFVFLAGFLLIMGNLEPAMEVPYVYFENPPALEAILILPIVLLVLSLAMLVLCVIRFVKRSGTALGRIYYSLLTLLSMSIIWSLHFWNMLF